MNRKQFFLHVGYPKTGSTFLQSVVFPSISNEENFYIGKRFDSSGKRIKDEWDDLFIDLLYKDNVSDSDIDRLSTKIDQLFNDNTKKVIASYEGFLFSSPLSNSPTYISLNLARLKKLILSLQARDVITKLLIIERKLPDLIYSNYVEHYKWCFSSHKKTRTFDNYVSTMIDEFPDELSYCLSDKVVSEVGNVEVFVSSFELLKQSNRLFVQGVLEFIESKMSIELDDIMPPKNVKRVESATGFYYSNGHTLADVLRNSVGYKYRNKLRKLIMFKFLMDRMSAITIFQGKKIDASKEALSKIDAFFLARRSEQ